MYLSGMEGPNRRDRLLGRWKDKVKEYMSERGTGRGGELEQAGKQCEQGEVEALLQ